MTKQAFLFPLLLLLTVTLFSQSKKNVDGEAITAILQQYISDDSPGMAIGVVQDGEIIYEQYLGYANLEHEVKIDQDTRFNIASNAKQFTALCVLQLLEQGKIKLEDDFRIYLPDLYKQSPDKITVANLLSHTSGLRDIYYLWSLKGQTWWKMFLDNGAAMELLQAQKGLNFKPGTAYEYSNSNYILLTEIVKKITGQDFSEFAKSIFVALDMPDTDFLTNYMAVIPNKARPYGNWNGWKEYPSVTEIHGDGALFTTLRDQLKWEQIIQLNDGTYLAQRIINASQAPIENDYGYGLEFDRYQEWDYAFHDGSTGAYNASFLRVPKEKISVVVMGNSGSVPISNLARQIAFLLLGLEENDALYPDGPDKIEDINSIQDLLGVYENDNGTIIKITEKDASLYRELYQRDPVKLLPEEGGLFAYETIEGLKMNFTNIGKPEQQFTIYRSSQKPSTYYRIASVKSDDFAKKELDGRFYNDETATEITLKFVEGDTYSLTTNGQVMDAELILDDYLMMNDYRIKFVRDQENKVIGLKVDNGRIRNVLFNKM